LRFIVRRNYSNTKEAKPIDERKAVHSSLDISKYLKNFLTLCDPVKYPPSDSAKIVRRLNDALQGRGEQTVEAMLSEVDAVCGRLGIYNSEWLMLRESIQDFRRRKELLSQEYTKTGDRQYPYEMHNGRKVINRQLYDRAARDGFPPGFFRDSFFHDVTLYCLPDAQDCSGSVFHLCTFAVCRISGMVDFESCSFYSCEFHSCAINSVSFRGATIAHTRFNDSVLKNVSFRDARMKSCSMTDCELNGISFLNAALDGCSFGRVKAHNIRNLHTAAITQGGATDEEAKHNREEIFSALRPEHNQRTITSKGRGAR